MSQVPTLDAKDPQEIKDYAVNWTALLAEEGETTIQTSTWSVSAPSGLTVLSLAPHAPRIDGGRTVVFVSGGTSGVTYTLTNTIVTGGATPRTHERTIIIPCVQR